MVLVSLPVAQELGQIDRRVGVPSALVHIATWTAVSEMGLAVSESTGGGGDAVGAGAIPRRRCSRLGQVVGVGEDAGDGLGDGGYEPEGCSRPCAGVSVISPSSCAPPLRCPCCHVTGSENR